MNSIFYDFDPTGSITSPSINFDVLNVNPPPNEPVVLVTDSWFHKTTFIDFLLEQDLKNILFSFGAHENEVPGRLLPLLTYDMKRNEFRQFWHHRTQSLFTFWLTGDGKLVKNCTNRFIPETLPTHPEAPSTPVEDTPHAELTLDDEKLTRWLLTVPQSKLDLFTTSFAEKHGLALTKGAPSTDVIATVLKVPVTAVTALDEERKSSKVLNHCPLCKKVNATLAKVECSTCKLWFHFDCDDELEAQDRDILTQEERDYYCPPCRKEVQSLPDDDEKSDLYAHFESMTVKELRAECRRQGTKPASGPKENILKGLVKHCKRVAKLPSSSKFIRDVVKNPPGNAKQALNYGAVVIDQHKALFNGTDRITVLLYKIPWLGVLKKNPKGVVIFNLARLLLVNAFGEEANSVPVDQPLPHTIYGFLRGVVDNWPLPNEQNHQVQPKRKAKSDGVAQLLEESLRKRVRLEYTEDILSPPLAAENTKRNVVDVSSFLSDESPPTQGKASPQTVDELPSRSSTQSIWFPITAAFRGKYMSSRIVLTSVSPFIAAPAAILLLVDMSEQSIPTAQVLVVPSSEASFCF